MSGTGEIGGVLQIQLVRLLVTLPSVVSQISQNRYFVFRREISVAGEVLLPTEPFSKKDEGEIRLLRPPESRKTPKDQIGAYLISPILYLPQNKSPLVSEAATTFIIHRS